MSDDPIWVEYGQSIYGPEKKCIKFSKILNGPNGEGGNLNSNGISGTLGDMGTMRCA